MISSFLILLKSIKSKLPTLIIISILVPVFSVGVNPIAIKYLFDQGLMGRNLNIIIYSMVAIVVSGLVTVFLNYLLSIKTREASNYFLEIFAPQAVDNYYRLSYQDIINKGNGYYLSRVYDEPRELAYEFIPSLVRTITNCATFIIGLAVAIYLAWQVTVVLLFIIPLLFMIAKKYNQKIKDVVNQETENEAKLREVISKCLKAFKTTTFFDLNDKINKMVCSKLNLFTTSAYNTQEKVSHFTMFSSLCFAIAETIVIILASFAIFLGYLTIGGMMGYLNLYGRMINAANRLSNNIPAFLKYQKYIERLQEILTISEQKESKNNGITKDISLDNFSFKYNGTPVFEKADIHIKKKSNVLIVGDNGSGKTTLVNILAGLLPIDSGKKELLSKKSIGGLIEPYHFIPGTARENLGLEKIKKEKQNEIMSLLERYKIKNKIDQHVGELSYGQKKKLYLIMTMTSNFDLYIYDEPLKGIDKVSRENVFNDIISKAKDSTLLVISHDNIEKNRFDQIINLSNNP